MTKKRKIEIFSAGCSVCNETIEEIKNLACQDCKVVVLDMHEENMVAQAKALGVRSIPAVAIDNQLAACCGDRGIDMDRLKELGLGQPLP